MWAIPPSPPARWNVRQGPWTGQRRPGPSVIAASIWSTVASPFATMCSASRQSASCSRFATNPGSSRSISITDFPTPAVEVGGAAGHGAGRSPGPPTTSTSGIRYGGLNGCPTTRRDGSAAVVAISLIGKPEVDDATTTSSVVAADQVGEQAPLELEVLRGALLDELGPVQASANEPATRSRDRSAPSSRPSSVNAGQAASTVRRSRASASSAGSQATTSNPRARKYAAQPPADDAGADAGDGADLRHGRAPAARRSRGPRPGWRPTRPAPR